MSSGNRSSGSVPAWRAATPDVVDSASDHSMTDVADELRPRSVSHSGSRPGSAAPGIDTVLDDIAVVAPSASRREREIDTSIRSDASGGGLPPRSAGSLACHPHPEAFDARRGTLADGSSELSLLLGTKERQLREVVAENQRLHDECESLQRRAEASEQRSAELAGLADRERSRHAGDHIRTSDLEAQVERLERRLHAADTDARVREEELRAAQTKLADATAVQRTLEAERHAGRQNEKHRAQLVEDRLAARTDELERAEGLLAATVKSREEALRRVQKGEDERSSLRRELSEVTREFNDFQDRVRSGALVSVSNLYEAQNAAQRNNARALIAEGNCERLLKLLSATRDFGSLVKEDVLGLGFVYAGPDAPVLHHHDGGAGVSSSTAATVRDAVTSANDARRNRRTTTSTSNGGARGSAGTTTSTVCATQPPQPRAAAMPLVSVDREQLYWVPKQVFDAAEKFRDQHLPASMPLACFHTFFVDVNSVWRDRLDSKLKALEHIAEREAEVRVGRHHNNINSSKPQAVQAHHPSSSSSRAAPAVLDADVFADGDIPAARALLAEADDVDALVKAASQRLDRIHKRSAIPRVIDPILADLLNGLTRAAAVHRRACSEVGRAEAHLREQVPRNHLNHSGAGVGGEADAARRAGTDLVGDAANSLRAAAVRLQQAALEPKAFADNLRTCAAQGNANLELVNPSRCMSVISNAAEQLDATVKELERAGAQLEVRASRIEATPVDASAHAQFQADARHHVRPRPI